VQLRYTSSRINITSPAWTSSVAASWLHTVYLPIVKTGCGSRLHTSPGLLLQMLLTPGGASSNSTAMAFNGWWSSSNASYVVRFRAPVAGGYSTSLRLFTADGNQQVGRGPFLPGGPCTHAYKG
jgi:hypothetical protein